MLGLKNSSVKLKLALILIGFAIVPASIVGGVSYLFSRNLSQKYAIDVVALAEETLSRLEKVYPQAKDILVTLSNKSEFSDISGSIQGIELISVSEILKEFAAVHQQFSIVVVTDIDQNIISTQTPGSRIIGHPFEDSLEYQEALKGNITQSKIVTSDLTGQFNFGFWTHAPLYSAWDKNTPIGVLSGFYSIEPIRNSIFNVRVEGHQQDKLRYFQLIRDDGLILIQPDFFNMPYLPLSHDLFAQIPKLRQINASGESSISIHLKDDWGQKIVGFAKSQPHHMIVLSFIDQSIVFRQIGTLRNFLIFFLTFILISGTLLVWPISKIVIEPLIRLLRGVKFISQGNLDHRVPIDKQDEFGIVSQAFNRMTAELQAAFEQLSHTNEELKRLDRMKDEFLANTSHELRTPLNGIIGISESLLDGLGGDLSPLQAQNLNLVVQSGKRLTSLINDILDFSRMKHHDLELSRVPIDIKQLGDLVLELSKAFVGGKPLKLYNHISRTLPLVWADENRLQQIMINLVGNAVKFTQDGDVRLEARLVEPDFDGPTQVINDDPEAESDQMVEICVSDTGIGIPVEKQQDIFKSFEQADGTIARDYGGTGLGLAITQSLVALHQGKLWVESEVGRGASFYFTLPVARHQVQQPGDMDGRIASISVKSLSRDNDRRQKIVGIKPFETERRLGVKDQREQVIVNDLDQVKALAVDDEPINLQVIQNNLMMAGLTVKTAISGAAALDLLESFKPDIILMDVMMPKLSGYETALKIRRIYPKEDLPIIFLTAKDQIGDLLQAYASGGNDYIVKPFSKNELLARIGFHLDLVSSRRKLTETEAKFRHIFENAVEGIFQIAPDGRFLDTNPAMLALLGYRSLPDLQAKAMFFKDCCSNENDRKTIEQQMQRKGQIISYECRLAGNAGKLIWVAITLHKVFDKQTGLHFYEGTCLDITQKKEKEIAQQEREKARAANQAKTEFLANISHEIRTPMNAIVGLTDLALKTQLTLKQKDYLDKIKTASQGLLNIINDILDLSKIEAGKLTVESIPFELKHIIDHLRDIFYDQADAKGIGLTFFIDNSVPCVLIGDPLRLSQILINLTHNAIKFTEKGNVEIEIACIEKSTQQVVLQFKVQDTGIGIPEGKIPELFQSFTQLDGSTTRKYGGTGLGLTICKHLIEIMGGVIQVESRVDTGTRFWLELEFKIPDPDMVEESVQYQKTTQIFDHDTKEDADTGRSDHSDFAKILLVEDNDINQQVAAEILQDIGVSISIAGNGKQALDRIAAESFDVILMDIQMPEMDGYETARHIRDQLNHKDVPILAMTAYNSREDREKSYQAGMNGYITKPLEPDQLYRELSKWIVVPDLDPTVDRNLLETEDKDNWQLPESLPGIDIKEGVSRVKGNRQLYIKLLKAFYQDHHDLPVQLTHLIQTRTYKQAAKLVHAIRGVSANISAGLLVQAANELETALENIKPTHPPHSAKDPGHGRNPDRIDTCLENFETQMDVLLSSIDQVLKQIPADRIANRPGNLLLKKNNHDIESAIATLKQLLEQGDADAEDYFAQYKHDIATDIEEQTLERLEHQIDTYNFDEAVLTLGHIKEVLNKTRQ